MAGKMLFTKMLRTRRFPFADADSGARGYISGTITVASVPSARRVSVRHRATSRIIATTFSGTDGTYQFDGLDPTQEFDVIARDWTGTYKDESANSVHPYPYTGSPATYPHGDYEPPAGNAVDLNFDTYVVASSVIPFAVWAA